jgi:hypothetical protein
MPAMPGDLSFCFSLLLDYVSIDRWLLKVPLVCRCSAHSTDARKSSDRYFCYHIFLDNISKDGSSSVALDASITGDLYECHSPFGIL